VDAQRISQTGGFTEGKITVIISIMPQVKCIVCFSKMYAKPFHLKKGWGKYCSKKCQNQSQMIGEYVECSNCNKEIYRSPKELRVSKSRNFFCNKSCQATWKNKNILYGENHKNWKNGENAYRNIMKRSKKKAICTHCNTTDFRVLVVHHIDKNRQSNHIDNLQWLCHNCHHLVHVHGIIV